MNAKIILVLMIVACFSLVLVESKKAKKTAAQTVVVVSEPPLIHDYLKLAFWFITGIIVGVYFEARLSFKTLVSPVLKYAIYGFLGAVSIFVMFQFATFVNNYL